MKYFFTIFFFLLAQFSFGQSNSFEKYFGLSQFANYGHGVHQSTSGSIFYGAYSDSPNALYSLISFSKLDENGVEVFTKFFGDSINHYMLMRMFSINDNDFLLVGTKMIHGGINTPYALRIDSAGNTIWELTDNSGINAWFSGVNRLSNGNIVFSGVISDTINNDINLLGVISDENGNILHRFTFGDAGANETSENCVVAVDGTILICGDKQINGSTVNPCVAAFDSIGNHLWDMTISSHLNSGSKNLLIDRNGDLLVIGESATNFSAQFDIQLTKINLTSTNIVWSKLITGSNFSDAGFALSETTDGNYAIAGYGQDTLLSAKRIILLLTDTSANELNKYYFGNSSINIGYDICPSVNGGFLIAGADFITNQQVLIYQRELGIGIEELSSQQLLIYPNPISNLAELHFEKPIDQLILMDVFGKTIAFNTYSYPENNFQLPELKTGIYFLRMKIKDRNYLSKLILTE